MLHKGFPVIVFDPNKDDHMIKNLKYHADMLGKQFHWIDFENYNKPQIDLLQGCTEYQFKQLTNMMFPNLKIRESDGNYYAQFSRLAREVYAQEVSSASCMYDLHQKIFEKYTEDHLKGEDGNIPQFVNEFLAMAKLGIMRVQDSIQIEEIINNGDVLYISCPEMEADDELSVLCRALFMRTLQIIKSRDEGNKKHVFLFVDEFADFVNASVKKAIEQVRKKACTLLMNMTSFESLRGTQKDVDSEAFIDTVKINSIKLIYAQPDSRIAKNVSNMTGEKIVKVEREYLERNEALKELQHAGETYQTPEKVPVYSSTIIENLPPNVGVLLGLGLPKLIQTDTLRYPSEVHKPNLINAREFQLKNDNVLGLESKGDKTSQQQNQSNDQNDLMEVL